MEDNRINNDVVDLNQKNNFRMNRVYSDISFIQFSLSKPALYLDYYAAQRRLAAQRAQQQQQQQQIDPSHPVGIQVCIRKKLLILLNIKCISIESYE